MTKKNKKVFTHGGYLHGDNRVGDRKPAVYLRETANFWVDHYGRKYNKKLGRGMGDWPMWSLDTDSIKPLREQKVIEK